MDFHELHDYLMKHQYPLIVFIIQRIEWEVAADARLQPSYNCLPESVVSYSFVFVFLPREAIE